MLFLLQLVEFKQQTRLEEKRKRALDQHLSFIVDQTEKFSSLVAESMNVTASSPASKTHSDGTVFLNWLLISFKI